MERQPRSGISCFQQHSNGQPLAMWLTANCKGDGVNKMPKRQWTHLLWWALQFVDMINNAKWKLKPKPNQNQNQNRFGLSSCTRIQQTRKQAQIKLTGHQTETNLLSGFPRSHETGRRERVQEGREGEVGEQEGEEKQRWKGRELVSKFPRAGQFQLAWKNFL